MDLDDFLFYFYFILFIIVEDILLKEVEGQRHHKVVTSQSQDHMTERRMPKVLEDDDVIQHSNSILTL